MRRVHSITQPWFLSVLLVLGGNDPLHEAFLRIQSKTLLSHVSYLASEECGGRQTPSPGLERAGSYLAEQLQKAGLEPGGDGGGFLRAWDWSISDTSPQAALKLQSEGKTRSFEPGKDFHVVEGSPQSELSGEPLFLGYGIEAAKYRYNDFVKSNPKGKILIVLAHEPREKVKGLAFEGLETTRHASLFQKAKDAAKYGALAMLVVLDPMNHSEQGPIRFRNTRARLGADANTSPVDIPLMTISLEAAEEILGQKLEAVQAEIDRGLSSKAIPCPGKTLKIRSALETRNVRPTNVVAFRPGSDPDLRKEIVVIGAHYDHVGTDERGVIWFGADDNASGSAVLVEIARAFTTTPTPRTLVFVAFSGEEDGLLGSAAFVKQMESVPIPAPETGEGAEGKGKRIAPVFPPSEMVAMLNIDMVGRGKRDEVHVQGLKLCPGMEPFLTKGQRKKSVPLRIDPDPSEKFFDRSDQINFYRAGVPVLFFMGVLNEHEDYHRPTDTTDKIDGIKLQSVARLIFLVAHQLATDKAKPERPKEAKSR